jgi:hypothetical protein
MVRHEALPANVGRAGDGRDVPQFSFIGNWERSVCPWFPYRAIPWSNCFAFPRRA